MIRRLLWRRTLRAALMAQKEEPMQTHVRTFSASPPVWTEPAADLLNDRRKPPATARVIESGEVITLPFPTKPREFFVAPMCASNRGVWRCETHRETFRYQEEADDHVTPHCAFVWLCLKHCRPETSKAIRRRKKS